MAAKIRHFYKEQKFRQKISSKKKKDRLMALQNLFYGFERIEKRRRIIFVF
jgi:hypothetical protein